MPWPSEQSSKASLIQSACSSPATSSSAKVDFLARQADSNRQIVARGLARFETGQLQPQPDWEQLSERVLSVLGQNPSPFTLNGTNCYLVGTGAKRLLVDTGEEHFGSETFMACLARCMEEYGVQGLEGLIITHMHHDHYGNIGNLQERYGPVPVYMRPMPQDSFPLIKGLQERDQLKEFLNQKGEPAWNPKLGGPTRELPSSIDLSWAADMVQNFPGDSTAIQLQYVFYFAWHSWNLLQKLQSGEYEWQRIADGTVISTEGATLTALYTPGHSEDHMAFLLEEEHSIFSGDHVLGWGTTIVFDMRDYMASLRRMLDLQPLRLYPGHGGHLEDGVDILERYISHREMREQQVWEALIRRSKPVPVMEIVMELYPDTPEDRYWMAKDNVEAILRKFYFDGAAGAWTQTSHSEGGGKFVPAEVPHSYSRRRLKRNLLWAAKRNMSSLAARL
jgi:glyoxylase-like metal-dependent hydrolase (beta-lactamase superfamily II)